MSTLVSKVCVANGGKTLIPYHGRFSTNPDIRPSPFIPCTSWRWRLRVAAYLVKDAVKRTGDGRQQRGWTAPRTTLVKQVQGKAHRPRKGLKTHLFMAMYFPEHLERPSRYFPWHNQIVQVPDVVSKGSV